MKFLILSALVAVAAAVPAHVGYGYAAPVAVGHAVSVVQPTIVQQHAQTVYAPLTSTNYGSKVNHIMPVPAPIIKGVPQPYAVPVPQPYAVPRAVPVAVPRAVPVAVPRAVPVPLVAQAAPLVTKSVVNAGLVYGNGLAYGAGLGYGNGLAYGAGAYGNGLAYGSGLIGAGAYGGHGIAAYGKGLY